MNRRPRRNRKSKEVRDLIKETQLMKSDLIYPLFVMGPQAGIDRTEILSMPGIFRHSELSLMQEVESSMKLGINNFCIFPALLEKEKSKDVKAAFDPDALYLKTIRKLKEEFPSSCLMTDVALDPYSPDGHDGLVEDGKILNDETLVLLSQMAICQAQAGADIIGPSDMMDGRVGSIRDCLDDAGYLDVSIMSYAAKYASSFYGPFRDALDSAPKFGDKKTYQMDFHNRREALIEGQLDFEEGADFLMVKPALSYLDIISDFKQNFLVPIAAYNVSGEYAMVKAAAERNWIDGDKMAYEILTSIKRAGADIILTYFAKELVLKKLL